MSVFSVFLGSALVTFAIALLRHRSSRRAVPTALRGGLIVIFTMTGITHFVVLRNDLIAMVPPGLPAPELLVTITGVLELAGAAGLLIRPVAAWAAGGLGLLLVGMFPANVYAAYAEVTLAGAAATPILPRTGMQLVYLGAAIVVFLALRDRALRWSEFRDRLRTHRVPIRSDRTDYIAASARNHRVSPVEEESSMDIERVHLWGFPDDKG